MSDAFSDSSLDRLFAGGGADDLPLEEIALQSFKSSVLGEPDSDAHVALGRYRLLRRIGRGASGMVYLAKDPELARSVAIKVVDPLERTEQQQQRLLDEARALAQISNRNIVAVYDAGRLTRGAPVARAGSVYIVMELIDGVSLDRWESTNRTDAEIVGAYLAAGRGLAAAHDRGVVHGDFKPHNAMVTADGEVKVVDFGLARGTFERASEHGGTPLFAAPELFDGNDATPASDQYAFAVSLWRALTNRPPFGEPDSVRRKVQGPPKVPAGGSKVLSVLRRALEPDPQSRFGNMNALLEALQRATKNLRPWLLAAVGTAGVVALGSLLVAAGGQPTCGPQASAWTQAEAAQLRRLLDVRVHQQDAEALHIRIDDDMRWSVADDNACSGAGVTEVDLQTAVARAFTTADDTALERADRFLSLLPSPEAKRSNATAAGDAAALVQAAYAAPPTEDLLKQAASWDESGRSDLAARYAGLACQNADDAQACLRYADLARQSGEASLLARAWVALAKRSAKDEPGRAGAFLDLAQPLLAGAAPSVRIDAHRLRGHLEARR